MRKQFNLLASLVLACLITLPVVAEDRDRHSTVNKGIRIEDNREAGNLDSVNGSIRIGNNAVVRSADSVNGGIRVGDGSTVGSIESVNGSIDLGSDVTVENDIESVNGGIRLDKGGQVGGDIGTVNGKIHLQESKVAGSIVTVNGPISILAGSEVVGDIRVEKPRGWNMSKKRKSVKVEIGEDAVVHGKLIFEHAVELDLHKSAVVGEIVGDDVKMVGSSTMY